MIKRLVPPKNRAVIRGTPSQVIIVSGITAMIVRKSAPAKVNRVNVYSRNSAVGFPGSISGNVPVVFFQIIRDLRRLKLNRHPEIAEEKYQSRGQS